MNDMPNNDIEDLLSSLNFVEETSFTAPTSPEELHTSARVLIPDDAIVDEQIEAVRRVLLENLRTGRMTIGVNDSSQEGEYIPTTTAISTSDDISDTLAEYGFYGDNDNDAIQDAELEESEEREEPALGVTDHEIESGSENIIPPEEMLPENSPTLLIDETTSRFSGTEWYNEIQKKRVLIAGIGGIGSNFAFQLARMCPETIIMYDDDRVERANMAGQLYSLNDVGSTKVDAISRMIREYTNTQSIYAYPLRFDTTAFNDIMICGFDNMEARKQFFEVWKIGMLNKPKEERDKCLYMDGRLSIDTLQILCISGDDQESIKKYEQEFLFSDEEAEHTVCSMKQTTYLACMIGSMMVNLFTNWVANSLNPMLPYDLPFFTEYDAQNMIFRTQR